MKIRLASNQRGAIAVIVLLVLLTVLLVIVGSNFRALSNLNRELQLMERKQVHRLDTRGSATTSPTNAPSTGSTRE